MSVTAPCRHLLPLRGAIKTYDWGSRRVLATLTGRPAPTPEPEAELWLGAHPLGMAEVGRGDGSWTPLAEAIEGAPEALLGSSSLARFGPELPFLLKLLAIERPLSLQAHPDRARAEAGFRREREAGRSLEQGNYRDPRHKPELIVALEPLRVLRGLLAPGEIVRRFRDAGIEALASALEALERRGAGGLRDFLAAALDPPEPARTQLLAELHRAAARSRERRAGPDEPQHWLARLAELHPADPALSAPLFLHLVGLAPGEGLLQPPRVLHCYLEGSAVEVMASSDNVVRLGLSSKPLDLEEALEVADLRPAEPEKLEAVGVTGGVARYPAPVAEFSLFRLESGAGGGPIELEAPPALLLGICVRGQGRMVAPRHGEELALAPGASFAVRPGAGRLRFEGALAAFAATVGPSLGSEGAEGSGATRAPREQGREP